MQKDLHIIEPYACVLLIFVIKFLFPMNFLICFGICSTPRLSKYVIFLAFTYKAIQWVLLIHTHQYLLYMSHPLF